MTHNVIGRIPRGNACQPPSALPPAPVTRPNPPEVVLPEPAGLVVEHSA